MHATDEVLNESNFPSIPSDHAGIEVTPVTEAKVKQILTRLNRIFPDSSGIGFAQAPVHNVMMDTQRKIIISDPVYYAEFTEGQDIAAAVLLAHEIGHYIHKVYTLSHVLPDRIYLTVPDEDFEHAWVEGFACEILRRAGYSESEIKRGYAIILGAMDRHFEQIAQSAAAQGATVMPVTDTQSRRWSVEHFFD